MMKLGVPSEGVFARKSWIATPVRKSVLMLYLSITVFLNNAPFKHLAISAC